MAKPPWMQMAEVFVGETEIPGALHNARIVEMFRLIGQPQFLEDEIPWCAAALGACLSLAGFANTKSALARSYERFGEDLGRSPREGCIAVFWRGSRASGKGHVGFYAGEKNHKILVLGGNQNNGFNITPYSKSQLLAYRWPVRTAGLPETFLPTILDIAPDNAPSHVKKGAHLPSPAKGLTCEPFRSSVATSAQFLRCHDIIAKWEGGYSDHPADPGGATNYGITIGVLAEWRGGPVSKDDVKALSYGEALEIFAARYWSVIRGDDLPGTVALMTYNAAVNSGPARGVRFLQKGLNAQGLGVDVDGEIGPQTIGAVREADQFRLVRAYAEIYGDFYEGLSTFAVFGRGWLNRLNDVTAKALDWAASEPVHDAGNRANSKAANKEDGLAEEDLTAIDKALGGKALAGKKTFIAAALYIVLIVAQAMGWLEGTMLENLTLPLEPAAPPGGSDPAALPHRVPPGGVEPVDLLKTILLSIAGLSALSKVERGLNGVKALVPRLRNGRR